MRNAATRTVLIVTFPGIQALDVVGPFEVFTGAAQVQDRLRPGPPAYDVRVVSSTGAPVRSETGLSLGTEPLPDPTLAVDTVLVAGGFGVEVARADHELVEWLRRVAPNARRLGTVCTGTFLAAEAGLLDGLTVTTHWARAERLAEQFPTLVVDPDPIFLRSTAGQIADQTSRSTSGSRSLDGGRSGGRQGSTSASPSGSTPGPTTRPTPGPTPGPTPAPTPGEVGCDVWTSAGVTAGIDMALAMVEDDLGTEIAQTVARWLVMFLRRPGGQTQFAAPVWMPRAERSSVRLVQQSIEDEPAGDHRVPTLAARAAMSPRHFSRVFTDEVGESPGQYVERVRLEAARRLLEETDDTVATIARRTGFGTAETMRRAFLRRLGVAPDHYRRRFGSAA